MIELKSVGILLRDPNENQPLDYLKKVFKKVGSKLHLLNHVLPGEKLDLIIALGGDGTVLKALDLNPDCPVLAVNFGSVGFLTAGDRTELESMVSRLLSGDFRIS